ncbi:MAG: lipid IV(A) 3-deoxy-D-manno-octulosonic acid transferase, partial [Gammaproteobacteria bacterium]|nr:lipid IV(A) 3-deoxy-D-manno-octulosonic acid transferase [Gammaproteobacteria bacterium]
PVGARGMVGETRAAAPMIDYFLDRHPELRILVTTMTPTGSDQVRQLFGQRVDHCYVPYDFPDAVARFLVRTRPRRAVIMETEIWPNIVHACRKRGIPLVFANVRLSEKSFASYRRIGSLIRPTLRSIDAFAVQGENDAGRLRRLGVSPNAIEVTGSVKFEVKLPASLMEVGQVLRREWGQERAVWIAGSTHDSEEVAALDAFRELRGLYPGLLLVIVPRHPERFTPVVKLCERTGFKVARRSETRLGLAPDVAILVGDTMGELTLLYAASDIAFVGGSFVRVGGHNVLEPCALGVPVVFGPHMFNFQDISELIVENGAGVMIESAAQLAGVVGELLADANRRFKMGETGKGLIEQNRGALRRTLAILERAAPPQSGTLVGRDINGE